MKKCAFPHARHIILWKIILLGRCHLAWSVEVRPTKFLSNVLINSSTLGLQAKKQDKFQMVSQNSLFIGQFMNCFITAREKRKIETIGVSVNLEFVSSFLPVNLKRAQCFVTTEDRNL